MKRLIFWILCRKLNKHALMNIGPVQPGYCKFRCSRCGDSAMMILLGNNLRYWRRQLRGRGW